MPANTHTPLAVADTAITDLAGRLRDAASVMVLTGAGISAESGIATFRDAQTGLWARYRAEDLATPEAFARDPGLVWRWYAWRREGVLAAEPNPGHHALAQLAEKVRTLTLVTQNVDGLHQRAGSRDVLELHGSIHRLHAFDGDPARHHDWPDPTGDEPAHDDTGRQLRPGVVWFGEELPAAVLAAATDAARAADVVLSIGTSAQVWPAAELPLLARRQGAYVVEINPTATASSAHFDLCLRGRAGEVLPALLSAMS